MYICLFFFFPIVYDYPRQLGVSGAFATIIENAFLQQFYLTVSQILNLVTAIITVCDSCLVITIFPLVVEYAFNLWIQTGVVWGYDPSISN